MTPRDHFLALFERRAAHRAALHALELAVARAAFHTGAAFLAMQRKKLPKDALRYVREADGLESDLLRTLRMQSAATSALKREPSWVPGLVFRPIIDIARRRAEIIRQEIRWIDVQLHRTARTAKPMPGDWRTLKTTRSSDHHTAGLGADAYARAAAEMACIEASAHCEARVRVVATEKPDRWGLVNVTRVVEVAVATEADVELVRLAPGMTLREWLAACWSRCVHPRVFVPGLPHDLEARLGVDYQGRFVEPRSKRSA